MIDYFSKETFLYNLTRKKSVGCNCFLNKKIIFLLNHSALIKTFHSPFYSYGGNSYPSALLHALKIRLYSLPM